MRALPSVPRLRPPPAGAHPAAPAAAGPGAAGVGSRGGVVGPGPGVPCGYPGQSAVLSGQRCCCQRGEGERLERAQCPPLQLLLWQSLTAAWQSTVYTTDWEEVRPQKGDGSSLRFAPPAATLRCVLPPAVRHVNHGETCPLLPSHQHSIGRAALRATGWEASRRERWPGHYSRHLC